MSFICIKALSNGITTVVGYLVLEAVAMEMYRECKSTSLPIPIRYQLASSPMSVVRLCSSQTSFH